MENLYLKPSELAISDSLNVFNYKLLGRDKCWYCGTMINLVNKTKDHFWPKRLKGRLRVVCCKNCNMEKQGMTPLQFINHLKAKKKKQIQFKELQQKFDRMIHATQSLWDRVKWSATVITKEQYLEAKQIVKAYEDQMKVNL